MIKEYEREARELELKMNARTGVIRRKIQSLLPADQPRVRNIVWLMEEMYLPAFLEGKYQKPSEFFLAEMPWIFGLVVYDRFRDAFLYIADSVFSYPHAVGMGRRSFRSRNYANYLYRFTMMLDTFMSPALMDADICDLLSGNIPEGMKLYLRQNPGMRNGYAPEVIAYELDRGNPRLEQIITDIIMDDSGTGTVSWKLIQGICMSRNERMHELLCRLLLAARLQEGLRQAVCESADSGTREAFRAILQTIREHDLIRYSSVKRAVGTWLGLMTDETRDLDRISGKTLDLVCRCLEDMDFRKKCLASEDSMEIYIAFWSYGFDSVEDALEILDAFIASGTPHQILTAGYYVANLDYARDKQPAAKKVLAKYRDRMDILAVYLPGFMPMASQMAYNLGNDRVDAEVKTYFGSRREGEEFCDWLMEVFSGMKKKELVFSPCIFPWYSAVLKKSSLAEMAMVIAAILEDQNRIDWLCSFIPECDSGCRSFYLKMLTIKKKTPAVRKAIVSCLEDRSFDTRHAAFEQAKGLVLTGEEYLRIESMLRLRYEDLRRNAMELLLKQGDGALLDSVKRLLASTKLPMRTAGLDMVTQLKKAGERESLVSACMEAVRGICNPTTQEKILIDALCPAEMPADEVLFTEEDGYYPVVELNSYASDCMRTFTELFPNSRLEQQVLAGVPVNHDAVKTQAEPCDGAKRAEAHINSLAAFVKANETQEFNYLGAWKRTVGCTPSEFRTYNINGPTVPLMDLWKSWAESEKIQPSELLAAFILSCGQPENCDYLIRCGKYMDDLFGAGFRTQIRCPYLGHVQRILHELVFETLQEPVIQAIASAIGIWISRCLPRDMRLGFREVGHALPELTSAQLWHSSGGEMSDALFMHRVQSACAAHFIAHPQICRFLNRLNLGMHGNLKNIIPIALNVFEETFDATARYSESIGKKMTNRVTVLLNSLYTDPTLFNRKPQLPDASTWIYAHNIGLVPEKTMYYHLIQGGLFKDALQLVTSVCAIKPEGEVKITGRNISGYNNYVIRNGFGSLIGNDSELTREQKDLVALSRKIAGKLVPIVLEAELRRGDTPAEYSGFVTGIRILFGAETFVRILSALGKDTLDRSVYYWGSSQSRRGNLSYLLARCVPGKDDSAEKLAELLKGKDISEKRLVEAALYSPAWIDIIGKYLNLPGFRSACYYFMAHMNEQFDDHKKAAIARYTPLSEDELNQGAFDVNWFRSAYEQLGEKKFELVYDAAKYISDGSKHTRARKYADAALGKMTAAETESAIIDKRNKDLLMAYALIPLDGEQDLVRRYLYLQRFVKESRQFGSQRSASEKKAAETALRNLATNAGFSDTLRLTLRMETKLVEDNRELFEVKQVGEWELKLCVDDGGKADIQCSKDGKPLKSVPTKLKKDPYVARLQEMKKLLTEQYRRTRKMLEQSMEDSAVFTLEELRQVCCNPVVAPMLKKLVFSAGEQLGFFDGENLIGMDMGLLADDKAENLMIAHPVSLYKSGNWSDFQKHLFDNRIIQPFRQVFRELYVKTEEELGRSTSLRYAGNQIQPKQTAGCLKERRWVADIEAGLQKIYYKENIVATIYALADWFTPADIEAPTLEYVAFYDRTTGKPLMIDDVPDVIFSEVMRDVDLAVSVAHAGGVDPETSHSTVEMRGAIASFVLPLLRLDNVSIQGSHAIIDGKRARYSVHLGSGVVHQLGGAMLNVMPVHSQHRGRFFLPFADEDPKTAEIISKIILFAEDGKLKDPTILNQLLPC